MSVGRVLEETKTTVRRMVHERSSLEDDNFWTKHADMASTSSTKFPERNRISTAWSLSKMQKGHHMELTELFFLWNHHIWHLFIFMSSLVVSVNLCSFQNIEKFFLLLHWTFLHPKWSDETWNNLFEPLALIKMAPVGSSYLEQTVHVLLWSMLFTLGPYLDKTHFTGLFPIYTQLNAYQLQPDPICSFIRQLFMVSTMRGRTEWKLIQYCE